MAPLSLSLYQFGQSRHAPPTADWLARPAGRLVWLIASGADEARSMLQFARVIREEDGHQVLLSAPAGTPAPGSGAILAELPDDTTASAAAWLGHWQPDAILVSGGVLRPALLHAAAARHIAMALVEARAPALPSGREGWYPGLIRSTLALFRDIQAIDELSARALRKAAGGARASDLRMSVAGRMEQPSAVLRANEAERAALARVMNTRPVWLAVSLTRAEEDAVIEAHRAGLRLAHRLLLILVPDDPARGPALAARLESEESWVVAQRALDEEPEAETEVFIADAQELGLWYRLAPISFFGGSLGGPGCIRNPLEAAALGSSVVHGPKPGEWGAAFGRLGAARAARAVTSGAELAEALSELLSPDRAARLAWSAWSVASEGVEVTARTLTLLRRMLGED